MGVLCEKPGTVLPSDRKSTRLNSSHLGISYAVFCLKKTTGPRSNTFCSCGAAPERFIRSRKLTGRPEPRRTPRPQRFFFFNDAGTAGIYPLSLHDALRI